MIRLLALCGVVALPGLLSGCDPCLDQGKHGVADPDADEFQLVFNNIVSRDNELVIDILDDDWDPVSALLCGETENITIGNFLVSTQTTFEIHSAISDSVCYVSPCCTSDCNSQHCDGPPLVDTTPFAGGVFVTGLVWRL